MWNFIKLVLALFFAMMLAIVHAVLGLTFIVVAAFLYFYAFNNSEETRTPL